MREAPLSTCERNFILQAIKQNRRLDGRKNIEQRRVTINFGSEYGSVLVSLGETKVLGQVSCELGVPKATRPTEGLMFINVELGPMAAPHFEAGRNSELNVQINRTLERTFKDSRCIDLESLCVKAEEWVWILRIDLNVLNHEGNLIDCCSIAALCSVMHFRRPDVSIIDDDIKIHTAAEKELIPMVLHHYPVCVSYCTFDDGQIAVVDPSAIEERTAESQMIFGLNSYSELCCLNLGGTTLTSSLLLLQCASRAAKQARAVIDCVKIALEKDKHDRASGKIVGFTECLREKNITTFPEDRLALRLRHFHFNDSQSEHVTVNSTNAVNSEEEGQEELSKVVTIGNNSAMLTSNQTNIQWVPDDDDNDDNIADICSDNITDDDDDDDDEGGDNYEEKAHDSKQHMEETKQQKQTKLKKVCDDSDSEEDQQMIL